MDKAFYGVKMDYRKQIYLVYLTVILLVKVITGQNVIIGTADFQIGRRAQIDCTFDDGTVNALLWKFSTTDIKDVPPGNIIIQYSVINNITIPDPDYQGRIQLTTDYSLVINEVIGTDRDLQYWCQVNLGGNNGDAPTNVTKIDPVAPEEITDNCVPTSKCKTGNSIECTVSCFNPSDNFNLTWSVDGDVRSGTTTEVTPSDSGNCFDGKSTYTIGEIDAMGTWIFKCEPEGRAYQYATLDEYSLSKDIEIVEVTTPTKNVGAIVGGVFGGIVVIGGVVGGVVYVCVYKEKN